MKALAVLRFWLDDFIQRSAANEAAGVFVREACYFTPGQAHRIRAALARLVPESGGENK